MISFHGNFRKEHQEIFLDGEFDSQVKMHFYLGKMSAEDVRLNPELVKALENKDLSKVFYRIIMIKTKDGFPDTVNFAQYLSGKIGDKNFLKLCYDYGNCLDRIPLDINFQDITLESLRESIEDIIYKYIKLLKLSNFEYLPVSFKEKHPELFLSENVPEEIRFKFYSGILDYEDIRENPELKDLLQSNNIRVGMKSLVLRDISKKSEHQPNRLSIWDVLTENEILEFAQKYGKYLENIDGSLLKNAKTIEDKDKIIQSEIESNIINRITRFDDTAPTFFKELHPELFLPDNAPEELKLFFYDGYVSKKEKYMDYTSGDYVLDYVLDFEKIKAHPEWETLLEDKDLKRAFPEKYSTLFNIFDLHEIFNLARKNPEAIEKMVQNGREETLKNWYKSTGGKFVPHHTIMLNFPEEEIDSFLSNSKKWSQLMKLSRYSLNDERKVALLKSAYCMGVFQGSDYGFNKLMEIYTGIPKELTEEQYNNIIRYLENNPANGINALVIKESETFKKNIKIIQDAYSLGKNGKYVLKINQEKDKQKTKEIRELLEKMDFIEVLKPEIVHQMFGSFKMKYNPDFVNFFYENFKKIVVDLDNVKELALIQRQFEDIVRINSGRKLTLDVAKDYIKSISYEGIDIGNEAVAEQAKIARYSQEDFNMIQKLYNEGEMRDFSSIPRIQGELDGYTYEILRCDDPLALTIGTLTDCCQEIHDSAQSSMEHSVVSPDGRVFCVRDNMGRIVAQSWFWRNQYVGCFDNIEIPNRIFKLYEKEHPKSGRKELTTKILEVYKKAAQDLMQEDKRVYDELLQNGTITQEQYDSLLLGKVTIGLGYNDIADAISRDKDLHESKINLYAKESDRLPHLYTDAYTQYTVLEREKIADSSKTQHNLYVHQDDLPVYNCTNMSNLVLFTMKRMKQESEKDSLGYIEEEENNEEENDQEISSSQRIISSIARKYLLNPNNTKIVATARIALIFSQENNKIKIVDLMSSPIKQDLTQEQKQKAENHIKYQIKKALKQIGIENNEVDISSLDNQQKLVLQSIIEEIEKENNKRGER